MNSSNERGPRRPPDVLPPYLYRLATIIMDATIDGSDHTTTVDFMEDWNAKYGAMPDGAQIYVALKRLAARGIIRSTITQVTLASGKTYPLYKHTITMMGIAAVQRSADYYRHQRKNGQP